MNRGVWTVILTLLPTLAFCGQVPIIDGVIGGVPRPSTIEKAANLIAEPVLAVTNTTTPGQLRFIENSGICGTYIWENQACRSPPSIRD